ncbi:MAG: T9SS type A sorting domain-containing protein [Bacteroidales bacterium]
MKYFISIVFSIFLFNPISAQENYYWVGGQGNWSDLNSWRDENGLIPVEMPHPNINVIFNEESFLWENDTVFIDIVHPALKNMTWENLPFQVVLYGDDTTSQMWVYGSLSSHPNLIYSYPGKIMFQSEQVGNTIDPHGIQFRNDLHFDGAGGEWTLLDTIIMAYNYASQSFGSIFLENGSLIASEKVIICGGIFSENQNQRKLDIENSELRLFNSSGYCCLIDNENLELNADYSSVYIESNQSIFMIINGMTSAIGHIYLNGIGCSAGKSIHANFVTINGENCSLFGNNSINHVEINAGYIVRLEASGNISLPGMHHYGYARLSGNVHFMNSNVFDTLILGPSYNLTGSFFTFQTGSTQEIIDSLYVRGNQCETMTLQASSPYTGLATIKKDEGEHDVSCDFLMIQAVAAESENLNFYAGANSNYFPLEDPPPGWIFENDTNFYYGFGGATMEACLGDTVMLDATCFNGDPFTQYYWNGDTVPGDITYTVFESQIVNIRVVYAPDCWIDDYVIVEFDSCENYIEKNFSHERISVYPNPSAGPIAFNLDRLIGQVELSIYSPEGKCLYMERFLVNGTEQKKIISLQWLDKGIYFIRIENDDKSFYSKFVLK